MTIAVAAPALDRKAERAILKRIENGLRMVTVPLPHLAGLAAAVRVHLDWRVPTMGIFASGRLVANPGFTSRLKDNELVFVLAHELLHLALRTHDRARGSGRLEFNYAHDYIINDILRSELGFATIPAGGLDMPGAKERSAEDIVLEMRRNADLMRSRTQVWEGKDATVRQALGRGRGNGASADAPNADDAGDVLADQTEREMFPAEAQDQARQKAEIEAAIARGQALAAAIGRQRARGTASGGMSALVSALRGQLRPAWQSALQRWIESSSAGERTFARPSRRGSDRADLVMPGRRRTSWTLNVVLDTSGSMTEVIPLALGAIADFCDGAGVDHIRLVQCDTLVTADETVSPDELASYAVRGFGGSDLSPAMLMLADDPLVRAAVIITDGDIAFPTEPMPYAVLWVLPHGAAFNPPYGQVISMDGSRP
jgi:predicted metal-dependent peptidase